MTQRLYGEAAGVGMREEWGEGEKYLGVLGLWVLGANRTNQHTQEQTRDLDQRRRHLGSCRRPYLT